MSNIKRFFDVSDLPRAKNDFRLMQALWYLEKVEKKEPESKTAIESRSNRKAAGIRPENREKVICGNCESEIFIDELCPCQE
jgi:hypothetical protein